MLIRCLKFWQLQINSFPQFIYIFFEIGVTLPVTSVMCERSISNLRLVKNDLRSTVTNDRLNGLALMYVHRNLTKQLDLDEIVDNFSREHFIYLFI